MAFINASKGGINMIPELNDTIMFIRDVSVFNKHGEIIDEIRIGERGRVIQIQHTSSSTLLGIRLSVVEKNVYQIHPKEVMVLEEGCGKEKVLLI